MLQVKKIRLLSEDMNIHAVNIPFDSSAYLRCMINIMQLLLDLTKNCTLSGLNGNIQQSKEKLISKTV